MAISMNGTAIDNTERENLIKSEVDLSVTGNAGSSAIQGGTLVGVTAEFATRFSTAMDAYVGNIKNILGQLNTEASKSGAFQGPGIQAAITKFISSVEEVANNYLDKLTLAEQNIIDSVAKVYESQDTSISSDMTTDASTLSNTI